MAQFCGWTIAICVGGWITVFAFDYLVLRFGLDLSSDLECEPKTEDYDDLESRAFEYLYAGETPETLKYGEFYPRPPYHRNYFQALRCKGAEMGLPVIGYLVLHESQYQSQAFVFIQEDSGVRVHWIRGWSSISAKSVWRGSRQIYERLVRWAEAGVPEESPRPTFIREVCFWWNGLHSEKELSVAVDRTVFEQFEQLVEPIVRDATAVFTRK